MSRTTRFLLVLLVAVGLASIASYAVYRAVTRIPVREVEVRSTQIVVAAKPVPVGAMLKADDVKLAAWPERAIVPNSFTSIEAVVNRGVVDGLEENQPITESRLAPVGSGAGLPPTITAGMRALSIKVDEVIGVAGFVVPGTHVDIIVTSRGGGGGRDEPMSRIVVNNIEVLTAGTRFDQEKSRQDGQPVPTSVVTLLVTPEDAERIALAQNQGQLSLALRNPLDTASVETQGVRMASLMGAPAPPPVERKVAGRVVMRTPKPEAPPAPKAYTVETIRAAKRTEETIR